MASTHLTFTNGTPTNNAKFTISVWSKRSGLASSDYMNIMNSRQTSSTSGLGLWWGNDSFYYNFGTGVTGTAYCQSTAKYRDVNGWYHMVVAGDTTQSGTDKLKFWINGEQITSFSNDQRSSFVGLDYDIGNTNYPILVGMKHDSTYYYNGSMSHLHFIDGTAYQASDFGLTDSTTGEWKINTAPNVTYGNNGFFILKDGNSVTDQSGNGNNFTVGGGTLTNTEDCPSNVFCTMNPLDFDYANVDTDLYYGNTLVYPRSNSNYNYAVSTLAMPKGNGKFYAEVKYLTYDTVTAGVGIVDMDYASEIFYQNYNLPEQTNSTSIGRVIYLKNGYSIIPSTENNSYGSSYANGDIIQIACDMENGAIYFGKNGTWQNSGDPTSGASKTGAIDISSQSWYTGTTHWGFWCGDKASNHDRFAWNFGNGSFGNTSGYSATPTITSTALVSEGTNASGIGKFEYDVPTGYTALSTKGLNE